MSRAVVERKKTAGLCQSRVAERTSSQFVFNDSLQNERDLGINLWEKDCPYTDGIAFAVPAPDGAGAGSTSWFDGLLRAMKKMCCTRKRVGCTKGPSGRKNRKSWL